MAEAVASGILRTVSDKLGTMVLGELQSLKDVGEELKKLESTLSTIRTVLEDAEARPKKERALVDWLKKLKDVAYDIDDVLDKAAVEALKHKPDQFECKKMVRKCLSFPKSLQFRHEVAKKIKEIRKRLDMISEEKSRFHLREGAAEHSEVNIGGPRETGSHVDKSQVYGRDEDKKGIIDFLLNKCNEKNLGVVSIVGLGGLGKTTLAQLVYNDDGQVSQHFVTKIWVYVSEKFEIKNVITSIMKSLTSEKYEPSSLALMQQDLLKHIEGKRFLLVLDDVWTEDCNHWDSLGSLLNHGAKGSKVIVTTRSTRVASVMNSDELHSLSGLSDDDCWKLFENRAFENGVNAGNRILVAIGKKIVKKCEGLPLAAKALGSALRFKREENQWRAVRDNEIWTLFEDDRDILPALMLSYNHLSPYLKQCFAYCSIFPKGTEIEIKMLVQLWVAEGFVGSSDGSWYMDQLISRSLLQNVMKYGRVYKDWVKMHDMVHNLAKSVAGDECSIVDATSGSSTSVLQNSRYTSLILDEAARSTALILSSGQKLQTLHLISKRFYSQEEEDACQNVLGTIFSNMKLLRALHLPRLVIKELPAIIKKLVHLRYLDLSWTKLKGLPQTIGLLHNLQTLKLQGTCLESLPKSIGDVVNLLTLDICDCTGIHSLPDTIGKLVHLQYLDLSWTNFQTLPLTIGALCNLQTLDLSYCEELEMLPESIGDLAKLLTLNLENCKSLHSLPDTIGKLVYLQNLNLARTSLQTLPPTIGTLHNLQTLHLLGCDQLEMLPESIGDLAKLLTLNLENCKSLHSLPDTIGKLIYLQNLNLSWTSLQTLPPTIGTVCNLQTLDLSYCEELEMLPESIGDLAKLLTLNLEICKSLHSLPDTIGKLVYLQNQSETNLQTLPPTIGGLENLLTLQLSGCENLHHLPDNIGCIFNLQVLDISYCLSLETLPESMSSLYNLQRLALRDCFRLHELPKNIQSMRSLTHLDIDGCDSLTSMPAGIGQLRQLRMLPMYVLGDGENNASLAELGTLMNLEGRLRIVNLQNVKDVAEASAANLREKQSIDSQDLEWDFDADWRDGNYAGIDDFENKRKTLMERVAAIDGKRVRLLEDVARSLQPHQNLRHLRIKGYVGKMLPTWMMDTPAAPFLVQLKLESFARCDNLQALEQLPCLEVLELKRFPLIECLPRLGQLPRLRTLTLYMLPGVKCLGSELYGGAGAFPALRELELEFMLGLEEWSGNANEGEDAFLSRLSGLALMDCPKLRALPSTFPSVEWLRMNADDELLLCYLERGAFPNLKEFVVGNCVDTEDESSMPEALVQRLNSVKYKMKYEKLIRWNHSRSEVEKMGLETLERIATEIENKLAIKPSS